MKDNVEVRNKRQKLYNAIKDEFDVGATFTEFDEKMNDPKRRELLYNTIKNSFDVGSFSDFNSKTSYSDVPAPSQRQVPQKSDEKEKAWWDTFLDTFRSNAGSNTSIAAYGEGRSGESYFQMALRNMPSGTNPAAGSQAVLGKKMGQMPVEDIAKWRMEQYRDNPVVSSIAEGFTSGLANFYDSATGGFNSRLLSEVEAKSDKEMKKLLGSQNYKKYKDNFDNTRLIRDISSGIASSIGFLTLANGFSATRLGQVFSKGILESGFMGKVLYSGLSSLQVLGAGAAAESVKDSGALKPLAFGSRAAEEVLGPKNGQPSNIFINLIENITKASMEGMSEAMLPEIKAIGKAKLSRLITKGITNFFTEGITENISDTAEDFFNWARERDLPAVSIIGDMVKNGTVGRDTFYRFMVEGLSGAVMGAGFSMFEKQLGEKGKEADSAISQYAKENPDKVRDFFTSVTESVKLKSASPEIMKATGVVAEFSHLMGFAQNSFDESKFESDERRAVHLSALKEAEESSRERLLPEINKIQKPNMLDHYLLSGKLKKEAYIRSLESQLGEALSSKAYEINDTHSFTSHLLFTLKQNPEVIGVYDELIKKHKTDIADDLLIASIYPEMTSLSKIKLSSSVPDSEFPQIEELLSKLDNSKLRAAVNEAAIEASIVQAKAKEKKVTFTEDENEALTQVSMSAIKGRKKQKDIFSDIKKNEDELSNDRAYLEVNAGEPELKDALVGGVPEINMDFLPDLTSGSGLNPYASKLASVGKYKAKDFIDKLKSEFILEDNHAGRLLDLILTRLPETEVHIISDDSEIDNMFSLNGMEKKALASFRGGVIRINAKGGFKNEYHLRRSVLHEALHSLTSQMLTEDDPSYDEQFDSELTRLREIAIKNIDISTLQGEAKDMVAYALKTNKELIAGLYSATAPHLVPLLDSVKTENKYGGKKKETSIWQGMVSAIKEAFFRNKKLNEGSLLEEINHLMDSTFGSLTQEAKISAIRPKPIEESVYEVKRPQRKSQAVKPPTEIKYEYDNEALVDFKASTAAKEPKDQDTKDDLPEVKESQSFKKDVIMMNSVENTARLLSLWSGRGVEGKDYHAFLSGFTFDQFMGFYSHIVSANDNDQIRSVLKREYERFHEGAVSFDEFTERRLRSVWNMVKSQSEQMVLNVKWSEGTGGGKEFYLVRQMGSYKSPEGVLMNTLQAPALLHKLLPEMEKVLGAALELNYINGFLKDGTSEVKGFHSSGKVTVKDCARALFDQMDSDGRQARYIFLNVFGERSTLPVLKVTSGNINLDVIDRILSVHGEALGNSYEREETLAEKVASASRVIVEELRLGNTAENLIKYSKDNALTLGANFAKLMKRSYLVSPDQHLEQDETLIEKLQLSDEALRPRGIYLGEKGKITAKAVILNTEGLTESVITTGSKAMIDGKLQEVQVPVVELLRNFAADKPTTDGASIYVLGTMDSVYRQAFGLLKGGDIKNFISHGSLFIKHAMHGVSPKDPIGRYMLQNDIAMITFDSSEKNGEFKKEGEPRYRKTSIQELIEGKIKDDQVLHIPLENFYHIKETGKADGEVKGLMQYVNSSGLTEANPILKKADPKKRLLDIFSHAAERMTERFNRQLRDYEAVDLQAASAFRKMRTDTITNQQKRISDILGDALSGSDSEVLKKIKGMLDSPLLFPFLTSGIHTRLIDCLKYTSSGSMPVIAPDLGYLTDSRIARIRGELLWKLLDEPLESPLLKGALPDIKVNETGLNFRDSVRALRDLKTEEQSLRQRIKEGEDLSEIEISDLKDKLKELSLFIDARYQNLIDAYNAFADEKNKDRQPDRHLRKAVKGSSVSFNQFIRMTPEITEWIENGLSRVIDRATGRLKGGYAMISLDIARRHGLKAGDSVMVSITPTDSLMGGSSFEIACILPEDMSAGNKIVLPSEYIQSVGKDYDVDVVSLFTYDRELYTPEEWNELTRGDGLLPKVYKGYVEALYNTMLDMGIDMPEVSREAAVTNEKVQLAFMQKYLGTTKEIDGRKITLKKDRFDMIGQDSFRLGDNFKKEVGSVVSLRTMQTMMSSIGFTGRLQGQVIDPSKNFLKNHIMLLIATNDKVDFPKRTNQLQYNSDPAKMEARMLNIDLLDKNGLFAVSMANRFIFSEIIELPRGKDVIFGGSRDLEDTLYYVEQAREKLSLLKTKEASRHEIIKGAKELAKSRLSGIKGVNITLINKAIEEYVNSIEIRSPEKYPVIAMAGGIDLNAVKSSVRGLDYNTYRETEYRIFKDFTGEIRDMFNAKSMRKEDNFINKGLLLAQKETYAFADKIDRDVIALTLALNSYDFSKGRTFDGSSKDRSLYLLREELIQLARPQQEKISVKAKDTVSDTARARVYPFLMEKLLDQKAFSFSPETKRGSSIELKNANDTVRVFRDRFDQLKIEYKGNVISAEDVKNSSVLKELFYGTGSLFSDRQFGHENRSQFNSLLPVSSQNIASEDRTELLKTYLDKRKGGYSQEELRAVFTSLLVPYRNITKHGPLSDKKTYQDYFSRYEELKGEKLSESQLEAYNKVMRHFNSGKSSMEFIRRTLESANLSLPHLEVPMNRHNLMKPHISQRRGYQGNDLLLEVTRHFDPEFTDLYIDLFSYHNPVDSRSAEKAKISGISKDSVKASSDYLPDFNNTSRAKWFDEAVERVKRRDKSVDAFLSQGSLSQLREFSKMLKRSPEEAFSYLKALTDDIEMQKVLLLTEDYTLTDMKEDIRQGNYEKFSRIYDSVPQRPLGSLLKEIDVSDLPASSSRMLLMYKELLRAKESLKSRDINWFKENILLPLNNIHTFALDNGLKLYNRQSRLNLKYCNLNHTVNPVREMDIQPVLDNQKIYNPNLNGYVGDAEIFAERSRQWAGQITEVMGELKAYLKSHQDYKNAVSEQLNLSNPEARAKLNKEIFRLAEFAFKQDERLKKITFEPKVGGIKVLYDGRETGEQELSTELYGTDKEKRNTFLAALQIRKLYDSGIRKVLLNAHTYLGEICADMAKDESGVAQQNAKYLLTLKNRYKNILDAIEGFTEAESSYMPHHYRDESQFKLMFKLAHWDSEVSKLVKVREQEVKRMRQGLKYDALLTQMTDKDIELKVTSSMDEFLETIQVDNPLSSVNPNWKERLAFSNDLYTMTDDSPHIQYLSNLERSLTNDMIFADSLLYQVRAVQSGENPYVIETMKWWYGNQLSNKLLHTKPISKSDIKPGMEVSFMVSEPLTVVRSMGRKTKFKGEIISSSLRHITVRLSGGTEKTYTFSHDIALTDERQETVIWGKVIRASKSEITLKDGASERTYSLDELYSRDISFRKDKNNLQRYIVRGAAEKLDTLAKERSWNMDDRKDIIYKLQRTPSVLLQALDKYNSIAILGGLGQAVSGLKNFIGGHLELLASNPALYFSYTQKGKKLYKSLEKLDTNKLDLSLKSMDLESRELYELKKALVQTGIIPSMVTMDQDILGAMGFGTMDANLDPEDLNISPEKWKDVKAYLDILNDRAGFSEHKERINSILNRMMTLDKKERMKAELELKIEEARYRSSQADLAFQADKSWTESEITELLKTLPEAEDINTITNIDRALAKKMFWNVLNNKTSEAMFYLFLKPEAMLRRNAFFAGYFEHLEMKPWDKKGALEAGKRKIANTQGLYSAAERQLGHGTALGKLALKFSQYSYNQWTVYRKLIPEAVSQALEHGWKSLNPVNNMAEKEGGKINIGTDDKPVYVTNAGRRLFSTLLLNSLTMAFTSTGIYGLGSVTNPVLSALVAWIKLILSAAEDDERELRRTKPHLRQKLKEDKRRELSQLLNDAIPWVGFGIKAPISMAVNENIDNLIKSNRNITIIKATSEQIMPGGNDPNWLYAVTGLYEKNDKKDKKSSR